METPKLVDHGDLGVFELRTDNPNECKSCCLGGHDCPFSFDMSKAHCGFGYFTPHDDAARATTVKWKLKA